MKQHIPFKLLLAYLILAFSSFSTHAASVYWIGDSGNWSDINHWATTSGGSVHPNTLPSPADNVIFDMNSFSIPGQTVLMDLSQAYCHDIIWQGVLNNPDFDLEGNLQVFGSFYLDSSMGIYGGVTASSTPKVQFLSSQAGEVIDFAGVVFGLGNGLSVIDLSIEGTGSFELLADMILEPGPSLSAASFGQLNGIFRTNDHAVTARTISIGVSGNHFTDFGSSTITANSLFLASSLANFDSDSTSFHIGLLNSPAFTCQELQVGMMLTTTADTFVVDTLSVITNGSSLSFVMVREHMSVTADAQNLRFTYLDIQGTYDFATNTASYLTMGSSTGFSNVLHRLADTICLHNIWAGRVVAIGGAVWNFGGSSIDLGNNVGVNFVNCDLVVGREAPKAQASQAQWSPTLLKPGEFLNVQTTELSHGLMELFDLQGRKVAESRSPMGSLHRIQVPAIANGQYIATFQTQDAVHHVRVMVQ